VEHDKPGNRGEDAEESIRRTAQVKAGREAEAVAAALAQLHADAAAGQNTMPALMAAVRAYATLGEIMSVLKGVYGVFREPVRL